MIALIWLRNDSEAGRVSLLWLFALVWAADSAAIFVGRSLRGPRLAPTISPGKTWSGLAGGIAGAAGAGAVTAWLADLPGLWLLVAISAGLALVAVGGDLAESAIKRHYG